MIQYTLSFASYHQHLIKVQLRFLAQAQQQIWLPTWIPGSYLIREFARHVEAVTVQASHPTDKLSIRKISKNQWQLSNQMPIEVEVSYLVYAYDLSVRGAYVDGERLYVNPAAVCMAVAGQEENAIGLDLIVPNELSHFSFAGSLQSQLAKQASELVQAQPADTQYQLGAINYYELIDQPFELAVQASASFRVKNIEHRVAISGQHQTDLSRLCTDLNRICAAQIDLFGGAPFADYVFMVMATANSYGGLEHQRSTSLITPRDDLPKSSEPEKPSTGYQRFLGLCSHEYFHSWLVKFIRPHNYVRPNLHQEDYTSLLWVFEGITSYYDDLMLYRSGVIDQLAYIDLVKDQLSRYLGNPGRQIQSVAESSFDAWIKYYRPDENSNNAGTSYYNKGALVALCLDLTLRQHGASLDQLLQQLYQHAQTGQQVNENTLPELCEQLAQQPLDDSSLNSFFADYVYGTAELPVTQLLAEFGIAVTLEQKVWPLGIKVQESPQGLLVQQVLRDSAAAQAGISAQDTIIAMNGLKASSSLLQQFAGLTDTSSQIECHLFRRDELKRLTVQANGFMLSSAKLAIADKSRLTRWLG